MSNTITDLVKFKIRRELQELIKEKLFPDQVYSKECLEILLGLRTLNNTINESISS